MAAMLEGESEGEMDDTLEESGSDVLWVRM